METATLDNLGNDFCQWRSISNPPFALIAVEHVKYFLVVIPVFATLQRKADWIQHVDSLL